ncbi:sulfate/molybdate ABC transporter ATP-binding protein [Piscinibacter sakaiensis]|uniref:Sulfate and thiosulfate import ATP-binding protein CysA n=1 Tax=Piscinibacter sakaiensis TaxID=1547922 RepID=A0A0K8P6M6_PISS1|nr:sulfate ABC transporter ATP-binding protein [Piscinibacter sakaiensis]GAP37870.1 sulfate and thiosulfate import ATP-binding protein CysA [Piscinibacter sakaiensis]
MSIQVRHIHKAFGSFTALGDVSLDVPSGELVALLGPSGCGKTTLLRIIAGLETADRGSVLLDGEDSSDTHVRERQVGFVFQHYALFRHMTVFENVAFGLRVKPRRQRPSDAQIARKVGELLDLVQLGWLADRYPAQLSGGQRQRIALARALAVEPRVLLLDEPFGALDAKVRKELRRWLRRLHDELHITSVFVTHDQEEALEVADRVVLMDHGRIEQVGTPTEVYERPATPFVFSFLGAVNRFAGHVDGAHLRVGEQALPLGAGTLAQGAEAQGFARPHELAVATQAVAGGVPATVGRVLSFGVASRVELQGVDGQPYEVELTRDRAEALALQAGQAVWLVPQRLSVFERPGSAPAPALAQAA